VATAAAGGGADAEGECSFMVELLGWPKLLLENTTFLLT
jgi:hypothetical protein